MRLSGLVQTWPDNSITCATYFASKSFDEIFKESVLVFFGSKSLERFVNDSNLRGDRGYGYLLELTCISLQNNSYFSRQNIFFHFKFCFYELECVKKLCELMRVFHECEYFHSMSNLISLAIFYLWFDYALKYFFVSDIILNFYYCIKWDKLLIIYN